MAVLTLEDLVKRQGLDGKKVVIRVDFNVPLNDQGEITSDNRLKASLPTIQMALAAGAKVLVLSHLGKPKEGEFDPKFSLKPVAVWLSEHLGFDVPLLANWLDGFDVPAGQVALAENVRFNVGEKKDDPELAKRIANLGDVYVMDAFATAHRAQATTCGAIKQAKIACAGPLLTAELNALGAALKSPEHPLLAITAGSKISTKLPLLNNLIGKVDTLLIGGGIANTLLKAEGAEVGKSLCEIELVETAKEILAKAKASGTHIPLPQDVVVAKQIEETAEPLVRKISEIEADDIILDIGPATIQAWQELIKASRTVVWNGPVGMFELAPFRAGTAQLAKTITENTSCFSLVGGGDTVAAIEACELKPSQFSYVSTAGGAFLEYMQGETLPAVAALEARAI